MLTLNVNSFFIFDVFLFQSLLNLAYSIISETDMEDSLDFIAPSETEYHIWTDGINALLGYAVSVNPLSLLI